MGQSLSRIRYVELKAKAMMNGIQVKAETIIPALAEAMTYSLHIMRESGDLEPSSLGGVLRTDELRKAALLVFPDPEVVLERKYDDLLERDFQHFCAQRRSILCSFDSSSLVTLDRARTELRREKSLMCLLQDRCLLDGIASHYSESYVDVQCLPPWSTWVAISQIPNTDYVGVLNWVPPEAQELSEYAVSVETCDALGWVCVNNEDLVLKEL